MLSIVRLSMNVLSLEFLLQMESDRDPRLVPTRPDQHRSPRCRDSQMASLSHYPTDISFHSRHRDDGMSGRSFRSDRHVLPAQGPNTSCSPFAFPHPDANIRYLVLHTLHKRQSCGEDVCGPRSAPVHAVLEQEESVMADMIFEARAVDIAPAVAQTTTQIRLLSDALSGSVHPTYNEPRPIALERSSALIGECDIRHGRRRIPSLAESVPEHERVSGPRRLRRHTTRVSIDRIVSAACELLQLRSARVLRFKACAHHIRSCPLCAHWNRR